MAARKTSTSKSSATAGGSFDKMVKTAVKSAKSSKKNADKPVAPVNPPEGSGDDQKIEEVLRRQGRDPETGARVRATAAPAPAPAPTPRTPPEVDSWPIIDEGRRSRAQAFAAELGEGYSTALREEQAFRASNPKAALIPESAPMRRRTAEGRRSDTPSAQGGAQTRVARKADRGRYVPLLDESKDDTTSAEATTSSPERRETLRTQAEEHEKAARRVEDYNRRTGAAKLDIPDSPFTKGNNNNPWGAVKATGESLGLGVEDFPIPTKTGENQTAGIGEAAPTSGRTNAATNDVQAADEAHDVALKALQEFRKTGIHEGVTLGGTEFRDKEAELKGKVNALKRKKYTARGQAGMAANETVGTSQEPVPNESGKYADPAAALQHHAARFQALPHGQGKEAARAEYHRIGTTQGYVEGVPMPCASGHCPTVIPPERHTAQDDVVCPSCLKKEMEGADVNAIRNSEEAAYDRGQRIQAGLITPKSSGIGTTKSTGDVNK